MTAQELYISGVFESFSTYCARRKLSEPENREVGLLLLSLLKRLSSSSLNSLHLDQLLKQVKAEHSATTESMSILIQFVQNYPPHQTNIFLRQFLLSLAAANCSHSTVKNYRSDINQFLLFASDFEIKKVMVKPKVLDFLRYEKQTGSSFATIKRKLASLNQFGLWLEKSGVIEPQGLAWLSQFNREYTTVVYDKPLVDTQNKPILPQEKIKRVSNGEQWNLPLPVSGAIPESVTLPGFLNQTAKNGSNHQDYRYRLQKGLRELQGSLNKKTYQWLFNYVNIAMIALFFIGLSYFGYQQFFGAVATPFAYPTSLTRPNRTLSFQGRLTDTAQNPITTATNFRFKLFDSGPSIVGGTQLWDSGTCSVTPDQDGIFSTGLGTDCGSEIAANVFSENANVWLEVTVIAETLSPRQSIKSVAYALNSETLQGYPASASAVANTVLVMNNSGEVVLGHPTPVLKSTGTSFAIEANMLTLRTTAGSNGDIVLSPDGLGKITATKYIEAPGATLSATYAGGTALTLKAGPTATADIMQWQNSAASALGVISASGNIGIGTTSTRAALDIAGNASLSGTLAFRGTTDPKIDILNGEAFGIRTSPGGDAGLTEYFTVLQNGNIGVGTTTPGGKLQIGSGQILVPTGALQTTPSYSFTGATGLGFFASGPSGSINWSHGGVARGSFGSTGVTLVAQNSIRWSANTDPEGAGDLAIGRNAAGVMEVNNGTPGQYRDIQIRAINPTSGNVGIGTTTATALLDVAGGASLSGTLAFRGTTDPKIDILNGEAFGIRTSPGGDAGLAERLTVLNNGNIGVGSTAPSQKFNVIGNSYFNGNVGIGTATPSTPLDIVADGAGAGFKIFGMSGNFVFQAGGVNGAGLISQSNSSTNGFVLGTDSGSTIAGSYLRLQTVGADRLTINNTGNVGIGTTNPASFKLQVAGSIGPNADSTYNLGSLALAWANIYGDTIYQSANQVCDTSGNCGDLLWENTLGVHHPRGAYAGVVDLVIGGNSTASADFRVTGLGNGSTDLAGYVYGRRFIDIDAQTYYTEPGNTTVAGAFAGNVGIGTTNPGAALHIQLPTAAADSATQYIQRSNPTLAGAVNTAQTALYGQQTFPTLNLTGGTSNTLTNFYGEYIDLTITNGTLTNYYGQYIAAPSGGTITNKYALVTASGAGNVGIGTTQPGHLFELNGTAATAANGIALGTSGTIDVELYRGAADLLTLASGDSFNIISGDFSMGAVGSQITVIDSARRLYTANGTVALPSHSFSADPNTGFYTDGSDKLQVTTGGTNRLVIDSAGNVGIGTTDPASFKLQVTGSVGPQTNNLYDLGSNLLRWATVYATAFKQNGNDVCDTTGNCTSSGLWQNTLNAFHPRNEWAGVADVLVGGTSTASAKFAFINVASGTPTASISGNLAIASPTGAGAATTYNVLNGGTINFRTSVGGDAGLTSRLFIANGGNIGIGTNNPTQTLHVQGDLRVQGNDITDSGDTTRITLGSNSTLTNTTTTLSGTTTLTASTLDSFTTAAALAMNSTTSLTLGDNSTIYGSDTASGDITIEGTSHATKTTSYVNLQPNGGNVGIGTASPAQKLHLSVGTMRLDNDYAIEWGGTNNAIYGNEASDFLKFKTNGTDQIILDSAGNFGIGTMTASQKLHVQGGMRLTGAFYDASNVPGTNGYIMLSTGTGTAWTNPEELLDSGWWDNTGNIIHPRSPYHNVADLAIGGNSTASAKFAFINVASGTPTASISGNLAIAVPTGATPATTYSVLNGGTLNLQTSVGGNAGLTSRFFMANNGNIGIGTTTTSEKLTIASTTQNTYLKVDNGSFTAVFGADTGTSIARLGTTSNNSFEFITNNIFRFKVNSTGEVGIGDSGPDADLEVSANAGGSGSVFMLSSDDNTDGDILTAMRAGNIGINTVTPGAKLHVVGAGGVSAGFMSGNVGIGTLTPTNLLVLNGSVATAAQGLGFSTAGAVDTVIYRSAADTLSLATGDAFDIVNGAFTQSFTTTTGTAHSIATNSLTTGTAVDISSTATALSSGKLLNISKTGATGSTAFTGDITSVGYSQTFTGGVGLASTGNVVDVTRAITLDNVGNTHTISGALMTLSDAGTQTAGTLTHTASVLDVIQNYTASTGTALYLKNYGAGTTFRADDVSGDTTPFIIKNDGNVGISTTTASYALDVNGQIRAGTLSGTATSYLCYDASNVLTPCSASVLSGSGTTNYIPKWTPNGTTLGNSVMYDDGTSVGVGTATFLTGAFGLPKMQIDKTSNGTQLLHRESADTGGATIEFLKRRSAWGIVTDGDRIGSIGFSAADSVDAANAAQIWAEVDGTPGSNDMPGRLVFATSPDGSATVTEKMRINAAGQVGIGTTSPSGSLNVVSPSAATNVTIGSNSVGNTYLAIATSAYSGGYTSLDAVSASGSTYGHIALNASPGNNANVGIGHTAPSSKLHVYEATSLGGTASNSQVLTTVAGYTSGGPNVLQERNYLYRDATGTTWTTARFHNGIDIDGGFSTPGTNTKVWWERDPSDNIQSWGNAATTYMSINAGNVGIGVTNPAAKFVIANNVATGFLDNYSEYQQILYDNGNAAGSYGFGIKGSTMVFNSGSAYSWDAAGTTTRMVIDTNGNLGVGTATPARQVHVYGTGSTLAALPDATKNGMLYIQDSAGAVGNGGAITFGASQGLFAGIKAYVQDGTANSKGDLVFALRNGTSDIALTERMRILSNGFIGMNTANPQAHLHVNGTIRAGSDTSTDGYVAMNSGSSTYQGYIEFYKPGTPTRVGYLGFNDAAGSTNNFTLNLENSAKFLVSGGNVGIGTTNPVSLFTAGSGTTNAISLGSNDPASGMWIRNDGSNTVISTNVGDMYFGYSGSSKNVRFMGGGTATQLMLTSVGNLGIGASAAAFPLHVQKADTTGWQAKYDNTTAGLGAEVYLAHGSGYGMHIRGWNATDSIYTLQMYNNTVETNSFFNSGRAALALPSTANVGIGTLTPAGKLDVWGNNTTYIGDTTTRAFEFRVSSGDMYIGSNTQAGDIFLRTTGGTAMVKLNTTLSEFVQDIRVGTAGTNGCVQGFGGASIAGTCSSDQRLKKNIASISNVLDTFVQLNPSTFNWRADEFPNRMYGQDQESGLIAQEVEGLFPDLVKTDSEGFKMVNYGPRLHMYTIQAIRELNGKVENITLDTSGAVVLAGSNGTYTVTSATSGSLVTRIVTAAQVISAKITAGLITTQELIVQNTAQIANLSVNQMTIAGQTLEDYIASIIQDQIQGGTTSIALDNNPNLENLTAQTATISGDLVADTAQFGSLNAGSTTLGSLLAEDASISGSLLAQSGAFDTLTVENASVSGELIAENITGTSARIAQLEAAQANLENVNSLTANLVNATVSGTLYANDIFDFDNKIAQTLQKPSFLQMITGNNPNEPAAINPVTVYDPATQAGYDPVNPEFFTEADGQNLVAGDVILGGSAVFVQKYLEVNGIAYVSKSLGIGENLIIGNGMYVSEGIIEYAPANNPSPVLAIQPSGNGSLSLLAGLMTLENGVVTITGNLNIAGNLKANTLLSNLLQPADFGNPFQVQVAGVSTESGEIKKSRFEIVNELGSPVATISAEGRANFAGGVTVGQDNLEVATVQGPQQSPPPSGPAPASASGQGTITTGATEITISHASATAGSIISVTPRGSTQNQVLYVKSQSEGSFVVGFDQAVGADVNFNWWIVN